jgi:hypothetical protein
LATATKAEKLKDQALAAEILEGYREQIASGSGLVLVSTECGKGLTDYLRVSLAYTDETGKTQQSHLTWAIAKQFGYSLKNRNGYWSLAISGYGYSKAYEVVSSLARFYQVNDQIRYNEN